MRILFVAPSRIGDAVLATGLLDHLIRTHEQAHITVACGPAAAGVFVRMPALTRLIVFEKRRGGRHWLKLWRSVVTTRWDLVVDVRASALAYLLPARRRAMWRQRGGHKTAELASLLGITPPPMPVAWTGPEDRARAAELLPGGEPILALGPTANWTGKVWPPDRFCALAAALRSGPLTGARVAVLAGPGGVEHALAAPVLAGVPGAIDLCGVLTLPEAAACLARATLFVGNDSGLMHLAAAAGAPTLGLFGPGEPARYAPAGRRTAIAVGDGPTMASLPVSRALEAARRLLE